MTHPTDPFIRFWRRVDTTGACWLWTGATQTRGYGVFAITRDHNVLAHRYAYESTVDRIPADMTLDHLCEVKHCVRPEHLEVVTRAENSRRGNERRGSCYCGVGDCPACARRVSSTAKVRAHRERKRSAA